MTSSFQHAHKRILALCDHFDAQREHVMGPSYKEAEAREEFITPFFEALGWDVRNTAHRSVYEKDVVIESRQNLSGTAKSADYAFRRPGTHLTSFFVEAKKPSVDIRGHAECYQAVLYGWNASTPLVVLTDFEQLLILDARSEPDRLGDGDPRAGRGRAGEVWPGGGARFAQGGCPAGDEQPDAGGGDDRNDLDGRLYQQFCAAKDLLKQTPEQAESREQLREMLTALDLETWTFSAGRKCFLIN